VNDTLDGHVYEFLTGVDISDREHSGWFTDIPKYSSSPEDNRAVREWLATNGWQTVVAELGEGEGFKAVITKGELTRQATGAQEWEALCKVLLKVPR